jgi:hypothetical protein
MKRILQKAHPVSIFVAIIMLLITISYQPVLAAMIETETVMVSVQGRQVRDQISNMLLREDVQSALKAEGIDPLEAKARIDSLSDAEVTLLADQINNLPAGAGGNLNIAYPWWLFPAIVLGAVLIIAGLVYLAISD